MKRAIVMACLVAATGLSGCGGTLGEFRPLYATAGGLGLSRVETRVADGRAAYLLREQVDDALAKDRGEPPLYRLLLSVKEARAPRGLRIDNVANRYELRLQVDYVLVDLGTKLALDRGSVSSTITYDSADQPYAGIAAHLDGERRAAADAAVRLRVALASYFANPRPDAEAAEDAAPVAGNVLTLTDRFDAQAVTPPSAKAQLQPGDDAFGDVFAPDRN